MSEPTISTTWQKLLLNSTKQPDAISKSKDEMEEFLELAQAKTNPVESLKALAVTSPSTVLVAFKKDDKIVVTTIHHIWSSTPPALGVTNRTLFFGLLGASDSREAVPVLINRSLMTDDTKVKAVKTPSIEALMNAALDSAAFKALQPDDEDEEVEEFIPAKCFPVPPSMGGAFGDPNGHIPEKIAAIVSMMIVGLQEQLKYDMDSTCGPVLQALWLLAQDKTTHPLASMDDFPRTTDSSALAYLQKTTVQLLGPASAPQAPPTSQEIMWKKVLEQQTDLQSKLVEHTLSQKADSTTSLKGWDNMDPYTKKRILFASTSFDPSNADSPLGEVPKEPNEIYQSFLKNTASQLSHLATLFATMKGAPKPIVDRQLAQAYAKGAIAPMDGNFPTRFSMFHAGKRPTEPMAGQDTTAGREDLEFNLKMATKSLSASDIEKLCDSKPRGPESVADLQSNLKNYKAMYQIPLTKDSIVVYSINQWLDHIENNPDAYDSQATRHFLTKIQFTIDLKIDAFLKSCTKAESIDQVNFGILNFQSEMDAILLRQFNANLPLTYLGLAKEPKAPSPAVVPGNDKKKPHDGGSEGEGQPDKKKRKKGNKKNNPDVDDLFKLRSGEDFTIFIVHFEELPEMDGEKICCSWQVLGFCNAGDKCPRAKTHKKLRGQTHESFHGWCKLCRGEE